MAEKSAPPIVKAAEFLIPERETLLHALDLDLPALREVKEALAADDVKRAATAYIQVFRTKKLHSPLFRDWAQTKRDPARGHKIATGCLEGHLIDGYNVYDVPASGIDWYKAPLFCLPRFPIFPYLLEAAWHTADPRYVRFIIDHSLEYMNAYPIADFAGKNGTMGYVDHYTVGPPTWWCLLPNRLEQWAHALALVRSWDVVTDEELLQILQRMVQEIRFLMTQVQHWVNRRHNVAGFMIRVIAILGDLLSEFAESRDWLARDLGWFVEYVQDAIYPDGLFKELTLGYSSSLVSQTLRALHALSDQVPAAEYRDRSIEMTTAMIGLAKPTGRVPSFGDAFGRALTTVLYGPGISLLHEPWLDALLAVTGGDEAEHPAWMKATASQPGPEPPFLTWPRPGQEVWGGYYAMRSDWSKLASYLMIDGGPWGTTHQHCDRLSFVLTAYGADFITDPCNTLYANNEPGAFISMCNAGFMHNTVTVDGVDEFIRDDTSWQVDKPLDNLWREQEDAVFFAGSFDFRPVKPVRWERRILFAGREYWLLQDVIAGDQDAAAIEQNFQFEEDIEITFDGSITVAAAPNGARLVIKPLGGELTPRLSIGEREPRLTWSTQYQPYPGQPTEFAHGRGWIARVTKSIIPAPAVTYSVQAELPAVLTLAIVPLAPGEEMPRMPRITAETNEKGTTWHLPVGEKTGGDLHWQTSPASCRLWRKESKSG